MMENNESHCDQLNNKASIMNMNNMYIEQG